MLTVILSYTAIVGLCLIIFSFIFYAVQYFKNLKRADLRVKIKKSNLKHEIYQTFYSLFWSGFCFHYHRYYIERADLMNLMNRISYENDYLRRAEAYKLMAIVCAGIFSLSVLRLLFLRIGFITENGILFADRIFIKKDKCFYSVDESELCIHFEKNKVPLHFKVLDSDRTSDILNKFYKKLYSDEKS